MSPPNGDIELGDMNWKLWRHWTALTALGEFAGFAVPAAVGGLLRPTLDGGTGHWTCLSFAGIMVVAGGAEGAVLGTSQALVLGWYLPAFPHREWIGRTIIGAMVAWALGMTPSTLVDAGVRTDFVQVIAVALAPLLLVSIAVLQWGVLRRYAPRAAWWIPANAIAWLGGVAAVFGGMAFVDERTPKGYVIGIGVTSGLAMGIIAAALSGVALAWLLRSWQSEAPSASSSCPSTTVGAA